MLIKDTVSADFRSSMWLLLYELSATDARGKVIGMGVYL